MNEVTYSEQQEIIDNNVWFDVLITYWNEDDDNTLEVSFATQYPNRDDIEQSIYNLDYCGGKNLKDFGGGFDFYEVTKVSKI